MQEAATVKVNRGRNDSRDAETERAMKSGDHHASTRGDHQSCQSKGHDGVNTDSFTQTKLSVLLRTTRCSQSKNSLKS